MARRTRAQDLIRLAGRERVARDASPVAGRKDERETKGRTSWRTEEALSNRGLLDREVVLSRVFDAPRDLVFRAWTEKEHFARWFGPRGFTTTIHAADMRVGAMLRFDMRAPDGTNYDNRIVFLEIKRPELLVFDPHGHDKDDDPERFRVTITFDEQRDMCHE